MSSSLCPSVELHALARRTNSHGDIVCVGDGANGVRGEVKLRLADETTGVLQGGVCAVFDGSWTVFHCDDVLQ